MLHHVEERAYYQFCLEGKRVGALGTVEGLSLC